MYEINAPLSSLSEVDDLKKKIIYGHIIEI